MAKLVLGAAQDHLALPKDVTKTALIYEATVKIYPELGHFLHFEQNWRSIADEILEALEGFKFN